MGEGPAIALPTERDGAACDPIPSPPLCAPCAPEGVRRGLGARDEERTRAESRPKRTGPEERGNVRDVVERLRRGPLSP